jgi:hypothetical protein
MPLVRFERTALNLGGSCSILLSYRGLFRADYNTPLPVRQGARLSSGVLLFRGKSAVVFTQFAAFVARLFVQSARSTP